MVSLCNKWSFSAIENYLIVFLFVFGLQIPVVKDTSLLLLFILPLRILFFKRGLNTIKYILQTRYVMNIVFSYLGLIFITALITLVHSQQDFSLIPTIINAILHLFVAAFIVCIFFKKGLDVTSVEKILVGIFVLQSVIQILAFFSPSIHSFVQLFQSDNTIEIADKFSGRRGLALAGTVFFGLSTIYGLIFFFLVRHCIDEKRASLGIIFVGIIILIGGFFTGRSYFVGVGIALLYFIFSPLSFALKLHDVFKVLIIICLTGMIVLYLLPSSLYRQIEQLIWYVFEFLYNYIESGTFSTTSSDHLFEDMYFGLSAKTLMFGDGLYTNAGGGYYMNTDAGYMRNLLMYGCIGMIFTILPDILLLWGHKSLYCYKLRIFSFFVFVYMMIIHIKGEVFGYLITLHSMLFIYYLFYVFHSSYSVNKYKGIFS